MKISDGWSAVAGSGSAHVSTDSGKPPVRGLIPGAFRMERGVLAMIRVADIQYSAFLVHTLKRVLWFGVMR
jgi:hypothetical protein